MSTTYMEYVRILHSLFEDGFMSAYREANSRRRRRVLPYLQAIHRRWYYATLVEHTPFSPANLMESISHYFGESPGTNPIPILRTPVKVSSVDVTTATYTMENHPIVSDIRKVVEYCSPHVDLCQEGCFSDAQSLDVAESLSINDPHYASFLLEVILWMKLLTKMPSLYVHRMQIAKNCKKRLSVPDEELFREIVNISISMTAYGLRNAMPLPEHIFTESFVRGLLTRPMETDAIFTKVFEVMGYDLEDILELSNTRMTDDEDISDLDIDMELLSGTFVMGVVMDRFFFTPFGHFMRLIRPMYALPFDFGGEVGDYASVCEDPEEAFVAFFAPCSSYTLTDLGLKFFNVKPTEENFFDVSTIPFDAMKDSIFADNFAIGTFVQMARQLSPLVFSGIMSPGNILTFRIRLEKKPSLWLHLQIPENVPLHDLYEEITDFFDLKDNSDYSFFHDKTENRFTEYTSVKRANRGAKSQGKGKTNKKTADIRLSELDFDHMEHMLLVAYNQTTPFDGDSRVRLQLERMGVKPPEIEQIYPRVSRVSAAMREQYGITVE